MGIISKTQSNWERFVTGLGLDDYLPSGLREWVEETVSSLKLALGGGSPEEQMKHSVRAAILLAPTIPLSMGATAVVLLPLAMTFIVGMLRMIPPFNTLWTGSGAKRTVGKDRDMPGWSRD